MIVRHLVEWLAARAKHDPAYRLGDSFTGAQLLTVLWHRGRQYLRGVPLRLRTRSVAGAVFRGRRVVVEHAGQLESGAGLILEDGVFVNALSRQGIRLGRNVTIARGATLVCTGVLANLGTGIRIGDRCGIGAGSFLGGQGGIDIGDDVILGPAVRIFSENHRFDVTDRPIREQGERRLGVSIGDDVWIGAGAIIVDGVTVGSGCVIAAGAVVTTDVAPMSVVAGVPARVIRSRRPGEARSVEPVAAPGLAPLQAQPLARAAHDLPRAQ